MIEDIRKSYELDELTEEKAGDDPFLLLRRWLDEALQAEIIEPNAMCLATVDEQWQPRRAVRAAARLGRRRAGVLHERQQREG
jgi:pyridoxine/pyridoxamine 5'-phosphate oxidase